MKLLLDTTLPRMIIMLIKDDDCIYSWDSEIQKKADALPAIFSELLKENKIKTSDIKEFYVTKGPGSFMGARTGLTFCRTIAQITGAKLFVANTLEFISKKNNEKTYVDAKSSKSFMFDPSTGATEIVDFKNDTEIDYVHIIENVSGYMPVFKEAIPSKAKPLYIKEPKIGGN